MALMYFYLMHGVAVFISTHIAPVLEALSNSPQSVLRFTLQHNVFYAALSNSAPTSSYEVYPIVSAGAHMSMCVCAFNVTTLSVLSMFLLLLLMGASMYVCALQTYNIHTLCHITKKVKKGKLDIHIKLVAIIWPIYVRATYK